MSIYFKDDNIRGNVTEKILTDTVLSFIENSDIEFVSQGLNGIGFSCHLKSDIIESPFSLRFFIECAAAKAPVVEV